MPWIKVHQLPDYAYFYHNVHVAAGLAPAERVAVPEPVGIVRVVEPGVYRPCDAAEPVDLEHPVRGGRRHQDIACSRAPGRVDGGDVPAEKGPDDPADGIHLEHHLALAQRAQRARDQRVAILESLDPEYGRVPLSHQGAVYQQQLRGHQWQAELLLGALPHHDIAAAGLVLQGEEQHAGGAAGGK